MKIEKQIRNLCTPAKIYFFLSVVSILALLSQNYLGSHTYTIGHKTIRTPHSNIFYFAFKFLMVLLWTYILQELCKYGYTKVSWFLVLMPFIFAALAMILFITMMVTH